MKYIQRKDSFGLETVDECTTYREACVLIKEYRISDYSARYYISSRACKDWK